MDLGRDRRLGEERELIADLVASVPVFVSPWSVADDADGLKGRSVLRGEHLRGGLGRGASGGGEYFSPVRESLRV